MMLSLVTFTLARTLLAVAPEQAALASRAQAASLDAARPVVDALCRQRCTLVDARVDVEEKRSTKDEVPGFEALATTQTEWLIGAVRVGVMVDDQLSQEFRRGLTAALSATVGTTGLGGLPRSPTSTVEIELRPIPWPTPATSAPTTPVIVAIPGPAPTAADAPGRAQAAPPPAVEPSPSDQLVASSVRAAPWLLGGLLMTALLGLVLRGRAAASGHPGPTPAGTMSPLTSETLGRGATATFAASDESLAETPAVQRCRADAALTAALVYRASRTAEPSRAAALLRLIGPTAHEALFAGSLHDPAYRRVAAHWNAVRPGAADLEALEAMVTALLDEGAGDPRLLFVWTLPVSAFLRASRGLELSTLAALLAALPPHLRLALQGAQPPARRIELLSLALREPAPTLSADERDRLAARCEHELERLRYHRRAKLWLAQSLEDLDLTAQRDFVRDLVAHNPAWARTARAICTEADLIDAAPTLLQRLAVTVPPRPLLAYLAGAVAEVRGPFAQALPKFLADLLGDEPRPDDETFRQARRAVLDAFAELEGAAGDEGGELDLAVVGES